MINNKEVYSQDIFNELNKLKSKTIIINGFNFSGKTRLLEAMRDDYISNGENVLYFETNRRLSISKDDMDSICVYQKLTLGFDILDGIQQSFDMSDPFILEEMKVGDLIHCGYMQLVNLFFSLERFHQKDKRKIILIIDNFELNLHPLVQRHLIKILNDYKIIKKIILSTYEWNEDFILPKTKSIAIDTLIKK
jgi:predicted ATP-dependent endonuclease of OLD family